MITLYGNDRSRATRNVWMLKELGVEYERNMVDHTKGEAKAADFLAINPGGKVPALTDGDVVMFESLAINLYLAMTYGKGSMWPDDAAGQAACVQWTMFSATEVEPHTVGALIELIFKPEAVRDKAAAQACLDKLPPVLNVLETTLNDRNYLGGESFTAADLNVACVVNSLNMIGFDFTPYPKMTAWVQRCVARQG
ncbi:MAG: glutathione S-transferase family protein [Rhodospirillaceae bacterium]|nr:glutathione S-transferase family protein [Rhodospirillaceae bacterium]